MPIAQSRPWLFCYDIADARRLGKVARLAKEYGIPFQYSVYLVIANQARLNELLEKIREAINEKEDDIRCYPVSKTRHILLGKQTLQEGIYLGNEYLPWINI